MAPGAVSLAIRDRICYNEGVPLKQMKGVAVMTNRYLIQLLAAQVAVMVQADCWSDYFSLSQAFMVGLRELYVVDQALSHDEYDYARELERTAYATVQARFK